ncbi:MAG: FAD-binding oxidoreductase [Candidatus Bathyarchaeia archaeon]
MSEKITLFQQQLSNIVGSENVITDPEVLLRYSYDQSFVDPVKPLLVIRPENADQVQAVIKLCNYHKIPVTPYTTGCNNQGAAIPALGGIIVDVSRMNRIVRIDPISRNALVEAGVTFEQLVEETRKVQTDLTPYGLRPSAPVELPACASVLVSLLEYNPTWTWPRYGGDDNDILSITRLILPTGEIMKTGLSAVPFVKKPYTDAAGAPASFINKIFYGAQGTMGIALEGWIKLMSRQETNKVLFWTFDKIEETFKPIREIKWLRYGYEMFLINSMELALMLSDKIPGGVHELRETLPNWALILILRGRLDEVEYQEEDLRELSSKLGIKMLTELPGLDKADEKILKEVELPQGWKKTSKYKGARNVIPFITPQTRIPTFTKAVSEICEKNGYPIEEVGCLAVPAYPEPGVVHCQYSFARDPNDYDETERVKNIYFKACEQLIDLGAFFSRPYGRLAELVYARAGTYHSVIKKFKQMIDPNNIMNPGKLLL